LRLYIDKGSGIPSYLIYSVPEYEHHIDLNRALAEIEELYTEQIFLEIVVLAGWIVEFRARTENRLAHFTELSTDCQIVVPYTAWQIKVPYTAW